jgi:hypothetical protein
MVSRWEVIKHLNMPDKTPPFSKEETIKWIEMCINKTTVMSKKQLLTNKEII